MHRDHQSIREKKCRDVLGEKGRRNGELTAVVQKRFGFSDGHVKLFAHRTKGKAPNEEVTWWRLPCSSICSYIPFRVRHLKCYSALPVPLMGMSSLP